MARTINFEGRSISVPDDATDAEVAEILGASSPAPAAAPKDGVAVDMAKSFATGAALRQRRSSAPRATWLT
jgi:hypothetical protein